MVGNAPSSKSMKSKKDSPFDPIKGLDSWRSFLFPNNVRDYRKKTNAGSLLQLARKIPSITYIRLSKIERGEVFARADELRAIAGALAVEPTALLIDIDDPAFDIAQWASDFQEPDHLDPVADSFSVILAAAVRSRRLSDDELTISSIESDYGIAPVILSRIENAYKPFERWNDDVKQSLIRFFGCGDTAAFTAHLLGLYESGALDRILPLIANSEIRIAKTRGKVASLKNALSDKDISSSKTRSRKAPPLRQALAELGADRRPPEENASAVHPSDTATIRLLPVFGAPLNDGLIARTPTGEQVEAPRHAGLSAYGLRVCRPTLGPGLPGQSIIVVDPERFPVGGGLAVLQEAEGLRILSITFDRHGKMFGYSENPDREIAMDDIDPANVATVLSALF